MINSDRILGAVVILGAIAFIAVARTIPHNPFLAGPVGGHVFPTGIGIVAALCGLAFIIRPDDEGEWPDTATWVRLALALAVLVAYAYGLKPLGYLLPTALAAGLLSYMISPKPLVAVLTGIGLSMLLFVIFRYGLGLSLAPLPRALAG